MSVPSQSSGAGASHSSADAAPQHRGTLVWTRNKFLAGFALALPLVITWWILFSIYNLLHGWSEPLVRYVVDLVNEMAGRQMLDAANPVFEKVVHFIGVMIPIAFLVALGVMATNVIGVRVVALFERLLLNIPVIAFIYKSLKQVIDAFKSLGGGQNFKRVAYIDYPVPGMRMIGFVTGQFTDRVSGKAMTSVFLPTAPNPMTGLLLVVDSEKVTDAAMTLEEATKMIFSGGLLPPSNAVPPLNQRPVDAALPAEVAAEANLDSDSETAAEELSALQLPPGLPRAEDFDSGDPDILASIDDVDDVRRGGSRRWLSALPWFKR